MKTTRAVLASAALLAACGDRTSPPRGQLVVYVDTDAPVPPAYGERAEGAPALFDRLRVDVLFPGDDAACATCSREFAVDASALAAGRLSFGLVPPTGAAGTRVRARLFRGGATLSGDPRPASTLETLASLPAIGAEGVVEATIVLRVADVGHPQGNTDAPAPALAGHPPPVGAWTEAARVPCAGAAGQGEVCAPGGAFWMGDPRLDVAGSNGENDGRLERLVVLSPFRFDDHETTVAELRTSGLARAGAADGSGQDPVQATGAADGCLFTLAPGANDALPVNCVTAGLAEAYCAARGKRLPSEAELEYAGGAFESAPYPWGADAPSCADAVYAREATSGVTGACRAKGSGPTRSGSGARDPYDLAGNLTEWTRDVWNAENEPCWGTGLFHDPVCTHDGKSDPGARSVRGAAWSSPASYVRAALRARAEKASFAVDATLGFRCARDAR